jgi:membrane protein implicated in regulation of membrane protease activity
VALLVGLILFAVLDPPLGTILLVVGVAFEVVEATFWTRYLKRIRVQTGVEGMVGERAEVFEPCEPRGRVRLRGEIWAAECERGAGIGEIVQIIEVERLTLVVEPVGPADLGQPAV